MGSMISNKGEKFRKKSEKIIEPLAGFTFMLTDKASTIPNMITRETNINQAIVFLYWVFQGFITTHSDASRSIPIRDQRMKKLNRCMKLALLSSLAKETFISKLDSRCRFLILIFRAIRMLFRSFRYGSSGTVFIFRELWNSNKEFDFQKDLEINFWMALSQI